MESATTMGKPTATAMGKPTAAMGSTTK